jgi:FtsH-binding integral membrane protein
MRFQPNQRPIPGAVATAGVDERMRFIRKTYAHLLGALLAFVGVMWGLQQTQFAEDFTIWAWGGGQYNWLLVIGGFMLVSWLADKWSHSDTSVATQYVGLIVYVVAQAIIFTPLIHIAAFYSDPSVLPNAALLTAFLFTGLTGTVFIMRKDFSFLRGILAIGGFAAMGLIVCGMLFGFELGLWFAVAMIIYSAGAVLYQTSQVMAHYRPTQYVGAALGLFSAVALMLYYVIILFLDLSRD